MDLIKKLIRGTKFKKDLENICKQFTQRFPNDKMKDLQHIHSFKDKYNPRITFRLDERIICCFINNDRVWKCIPKFILTSYGCRKIGDDNESEDHSDSYYDNNNEDENDDNKEEDNEDDEVALPTIWKKTDGVSFELYPLEDDFMLLTLHDLGFHKDKLTYLGEALDDDKTSIGELLDNQKLDKSLFRSTNISWKKGL